MSSPAKQFQSLAGIVGEANTSADPQTLGAYAIDGHLPGVVVRPSSAEEIAEIIRFCVSGKLAVVPAAHGTKLRIGATPARYDVALATTRLDKIPAYDPGDLTVSVEAGARVSDLLALLAKNRQMLPLAVPYQNQASVGGTVASGVDSALRQRYGTVRDFLVGVEFVTGDAIRAKSGGRVVKNVAGYDLHKLFIGSLGTLGVITRLNFKTFPAPEASGGFLASFANEASALELLRRIRHSPLRVTTLEVLSPTLADLFASRTPATAPDTPPGSWLSRSSWAVATSFGGSDAALRRTTSELEDMAGEVGATATTLLAEDNRAALWVRIREVIPLLLDSSPAATIIRLSALPTRLGEILGAAQRSADRDELPVAILARAVGVAYVAFLPGQLDEQTLEHLAGATVEMADAAAAAKGYSFVAWCPPELKGRVALWGKQRADNHLMRKVKHAFDPENILSPGRYIGGI